MNKTRKSRRRLRRCFFFFHDWGWPIRAVKDGPDIQTCTRCGKTRLSKVRFGPSNVGQKEGPP